MPDPTVPDSSNPKPPDGKFSDFSFKEAVTAVIALSIVLTLVGMLIYGFSADSLDENKKYLIGIVLSLAGTVTGYYFGRVPAEKRADTAEKAATDAQKEKGKADAKVEDAKKTLDRLLPEPTGTMRLDKTAVQEALPSASVSQELVALRRRL